MKKNLKKGTLFALSLVMLFSTLAMMGVVYAEGRDSVIIHYHKNNQTEEVIDKIYTDETETMEGLTLFTVENRNCIGWSKNPDGTGEYYDSNTLVREVIGEESEIDIYAIWETYTLIFNDTQNGEEYEYMRLESDGSEEVEIPDMMQRNMEEVFAGWKSETDQQIYTPRDKIVVKEDTVFNAVWNKVTKQSNSEKETESPLQIDYNRMNIYDTYKETDSQKKTVSDNLTNAIDYPDEFREDGTVTRKFLYWSLSPVKYVDDEMPAIYPGDDLTPYYEYKRLDNTLSLYAIYENKNLGIEYWLESWEGYMDDSQYQYEFTENGFHLKDVTIKDPSTMEEFDDHVYDRWNTGWGWETTSLIHPGHYSLLEIEKPEAEDIGYQKFCNIFINGYVQLFGEVSDRGFKVDYMPITIEDTNYYGTQKGQKYVIEIKDGKSLEYDDYKFMGWSIYQYGNVDLYAGQKISITALKQLMKDAGRLEDGCLYLYPVLKKTVKIEYDLSDLPFDIEQSSDEYVTEGSHHMLRDMSKEFEKAGYVFIGWTDQQQNKYCVDLAYRMNSDLMMTPIYTKPMTIKVKYESSLFPDFICPQDTKEYNIGDNIPLKSCPYGYISSNEPDREDMVFYDWSFDGRYRVSRNQRDNNTINSIGYLRWIDFENRTLTLKAEFTPSYDYIILNPNATDVSYQNDLYFSYDIPTTGYPIERKGYYLTGWSTTPDNSGENNKFYSFGVEYNEEVEADENGVRQLYAQWKTVEEASHDDSFCKVNVIYDLGHEQKQEMSVYRKKGTNFFLQMWEVENTAFEGLIKSGGSTTVDDLGNPFYIVPNSKEVDCEMMTAKLDIEFYDGQHGKLKNSSDQIVQCLSVNSRKGNYSRILDEMAIPVPDVGYRFKGWELLPLCKIDLFINQEPKRSSNDSGDYKVLYKTKKDIWSTEELSSMIINEDNIIDFLYNKNLYMVRMTSLMITPVFEKIEKTSATVHYYYDGIEDRDAMYTISDINVGDKVETYTDKLKEGYVLEKTENFPLVASKDISQNQIHIYYIKKNIDIDVPDKPSDGEDDNKQPVNPEQPIIKDENDINKENNMNTPITEDQQNIGIWFVLLIGGGICIQFMQKNRKRKE